MSDVYAIRGPVYSRKSTIGLSLPGGKYIFDLERGVHRAKIEWPDDVMDVWVPPLDVSILNHYRGDRVEGKREAWELLTSQYVAALQRNDVKVIMFDTAKILWTACHKCILQIKQEHQVMTQMKKVNMTEAAAIDYFEAVGWKQTLGEFEYDTPNERMDNLINLSRGFDKDLVFINHERPVRGPTVVKGEVQMLPIPGKFELDGWKRTLQLSDWVIRTDIEEKDGSVKFYGTIEKCPLGSKAVGKRVENLTMPGAENLARILESI